MPKSLLYLCLSATLYSGHLLANTCPELYSATRSNNASAIPKLFANCNMLFHLITNPWTPLHEAAYFNAPEAAAVLIGLGLNIDAVDGNGYTPLRLAHIKGYTQMKNLLLFYGAKY